MHSARHGQPRAGDPGDDDLRTEAALDLPAGNPSKGGELAIARQRMRGDEAPVLTIAANT
jgi:hypothetical protein